MYILTSFKPIYKFVNSNTPPPHTHTHAPYFHPGSQTLKVVKCLAHHKLSNPVSLPYIQDESRRFLMKSSMFTITNITTP